MATPIQWPALGRLLVRFGCAMLGQDYRRPVLDAWTADKRRVEICAPVWEEYPEAHALAALPAIRHGRPPHLPPGWAVRPAERPLTFA